MLFPEKDNLTRYARHETLGILTINCDTIETKETDSPESCKRNTSQEIDATDEYYINTDNITKFENEDKPMLTDNDSNTVKYFLPGPNSNSDEKASAEITQWLQREFKNLFNGIWCFNSTFSLQVKPDSKSYQVPPRYNAYTLYKDHSKKN